MLKTKIEYDLFCILEEYNTFISEQRNELVDGLSGDEIKEKYDILLNSFTDLQNKLLK